MAWELPPKARKAREVVAHSNATFNVCDGPVRSGKTVGINIRWLEYTAREAPPGDLLMVGKTERTLLRNVVKPMQDEFGSSVVQINRGDGTIHILGRRIYLVGANDESSEGKIRGMTLAGAYGDELTLWPKNFWEMLGTRLSVGGSRFFGSTNPGPPRHYIKQLLDAKDPAVRRFHFQLDDNPFLEEEYKARLKRQYTGVFYKRMILGQWVAAEGAIYEMFDEDVHVVDSPPGDLTTFAVGGDYGASNATCFVLLGWGGRDGRVYVLDAYYYDGAAMRKAMSDGLPDGAVVTGAIRTNEEHAEGLARLTSMLARRTQHDPRSVFRGRVYLDPSALALAEVLRRRGYSVVPAVNDVSYGIGLTSNLWALDRLRIVRTPGTEHVIESVSGYAWNPKKQLLGEDAPIKEGDHGADALRYPIATDPGLVRLALDPPGNAPEVGWATMN